MSWCSSTARIRVKVRVGNTPGAVPEASRAPVCRILQTVSALIPSFTVVDRGHRFSDNTCWACFWLSARGASDAWDAAGPSFVRLDFSDEVSPPADADSEEQGDVYERQWWPQSADANDTAPAGAVSLEQVGASTVDDGDGVQNPSGAMQVVAGDNGAVTEGDGADERPPEWHADGGGRQLRGHRGRWGT